MNKIGLALCHFEQNDSSTLTHTYILEKQFFRSSLHFCCCSCLKSISVILKKTILGEVWRRKDDNHDFFYFFDRTTGTKLTLKSQNNYRGAYMPGLMHWEWDSCFFVTSHPRKDKNGVFYVWKIWEKLRKLRKLRHFTREKDKNV